MDEIVAESYRESGNAIWELESVKRRRAALLERGAQQGWLLRSSDLQLCGLIGTGTFGQTYEALWRGARVSPSTATATLPMHACDSW
jgi:hypothetical protein